MALLLVSGYEAAGCAATAAVKLCEEAAQRLCRFRLGPDHPSTLGIMASLARSYNAAGQRDRALKLHEEVLALRRAKLGPDHPDTLESMNNLANSYVGADQFDRALKLREQVLALVPFQAEPRPPRHRSDREGLRVGR